ncbi:hypothetical protein KP814_07000 [Hahella sp. HN01]|nr:hypothetical protein [Hahella sp. HN01]
MPVITGKGPDFSRIKNEERGIGNYRLSLSLPGNVLTPNRPSDPEPSYLNLREDLFGQICRTEYNRTFARLCFQWWGYKGVFFQGAMGDLGRLSMYVDVNSVAKHTQVACDDLASLEAYLKKDYWLYYEDKEGVNWKARERFKDDPFLGGETPPQFLVGLPENYKKERINDLDWLAYSLTGEGITGAHKSFYWAYPLDENFYLTVVFWADSDVGDKEIRLQRMLTDAKKIMSMVELRKE